MYNYETILMTESMIYFLGAIIIKLLPLVSVFLVNSRQAQLSYAHSLNKKQCWCIGRKIQGTWMPCCSETRSFATKSLNL